MFKRSLGVLISAALGIASSGSIVMADENVQLKEVVVTATKTEKQPQDVTQSVTVISADEIQKSGATNVAEVMSTKAGVMVNEQGPVGALQSVTVRGSTYQQVLVLLDGKRLNSGSAGGYDLSELPVPMSAIERIEIVRGPSSALYGSDAMGGVVNIITKKPTTPLTTLSGSMGRNGYTSASLYNTGRENNTYYTLSLGKERSHGYRDNSDSDQKVAGIKIGYDLDTSSSIEGTFDYITKDLGVPGSVQFPSPIARQQTREAISGLQYKARISQGLDYGLRVYRNQEHIGYQNPDFLEFDTNRSVTSGTETQVNWLMSSFSLLTAGVEGREDSLVNNAAGTHTATISSEYIQDELNLGDSVIVVLGGRNDDHSAFGNKFSPRASVRYLQAGSGTILRASTGKGFRAPTLNDLYFQDAFGDHGNPNLRPETSEEFEGGIEQPFGSGNFIKFTAFKRRVNDLIVWQPIDLLNPFAFTPMNIGRARITGTEAELHFLISKMLSGSINYTRMFPVDLLTGERIFSDVSHIPDMELGAYLSVALDNQTTLSLNGRRVKNYVQPGAEKWEYYTVDGKITGTVAAEKSFKMDVFIGMKNMFNRKYETIAGYPMPPQELYGGITAQF
ncbi:MAG: TonB-dependent receptor [Nitrospirota bacterium]